MGLEEGRGGRGVFLAIAGGMQANRNEIGIDLEMGIMALALPMNRGLDPAIGIAHVKCVRSICASSKYVKSLPLAPGRVGRKEGGGRRGVSGFRPSKGRIWWRRKLGGGLAIRARSFVARWNYALMACNALTNPVINSHPVCVRST